MEQEHYVSGRIVSTDPLVTFSKRSLGVPLGIASARPEAFRGRKALHLIGFSHTIEVGESMTGIAQELAALSREQPDGRFVFLANTEFEAYQLSTVGVASMMSNQLIFVDEKTFRPRECEMRFDAIYNGRLVPSKRHELARDVRSLGLLYDIGSPSTPPQYEHIRTLLPQATFINHEVGKGSYRQLTIEECAAQINTARVGLCLSEEEGAMQASLEYLLCGLPVVSTRSIGGRDRYLPAPFGRIVGDDPKEVADAVAAFTRARIQKAAVRGHIMHLINFDRHNFLIAVNKLAKETFGIGHLFKSFAPFEIGLTRWRKADDILAPLAAA